MVSRDKLVEEVLKYSQKIYEFYKIIEYKKYATNILDNIKNNYIIKNPIILDDYIKQLKEQTK